MKIVCSEDHKLHFPKGELYCGTFVTPFERPSRMDYTLNRLRELARRQEDLNKQLKELQSALEEAASEEEKADFEKEEEEVSPQTDEQESTK